MAALTAPPPTDTTTAPAPSTLARILALPALGSFSALILCCVVFSLTTHNFLSGGNLSLVLQQVMVVGTLAIGQSIVILTAGIDLSNGPVMRFGSIVVPKLPAHSRLPVPLPVL